MNRRGAGVAFIAIAAFLTSVRYLFNFAFIAGWWSNEFKNSLFIPINRNLNIFSIIALIVGIVYIIVAETKKDK